ncbi:hypothetical protein DM01DRAFT_1314514 [Hesseltinella vesiculosa]|uniref:RRM domain-containing protein n=1 Tax=Hesseltinella vesiculosa TaxID=101127 RepID=A0A1X2GXQ7_9FUNG|nr:hypothetical protein DM01DRAFT_1314514 [Hesseltinella vesiculosa]
MAESATQETSGLHGLNNITSPAPIEPIADNDYDLDSDKAPPITQVRQLFIGNLPFRVRWQDVKDLFRRAGPVLRADVALSYDNRSKGHGTVLFSKVEDAQRAIDMLHNYRWHGRVLEVREDRGYVERKTSLSESTTDPAQPDHDHEAELILPSPDQGVTHLGRQLFVGNLPFAAQWQDIKDLFRPAGKVIRADVAQDFDGRSRGFGTVLFATPEDADNAVEWFDGYDYQGRRLRVHHDKFAANGSHILQRRQMYPPIQPKYTTLEFSDVPDANVLESLKQTYGNAANPMYAVPVHTPSYLNFAPLDRPMPHPKPGSTDVSQVNNNSYYPPPSAGQLPYDFMPPYPPPTGYYPSPQQNPPTPSSSYPPVFDHPPSSTPSHPPPLQDHAVLSSGSSASPFFLPPDASSPSSHMSPSGQPPMLTSAYPPSWMMQTHHLQSSPQTGPPQSYQEKQEASLPGLYPYELYQGKEHSITAMVDGMQRMGLTDPSAGLNDRNDADRLHHLSGGHSQEYLPSPHSGTPSHPGSTSHPGSNSGVWNFQL